MRDEVCAEDVATAIREAMERVIPPERRTPGWDRKWKRVEEFANVTDQD